MSKVKDKFTPTVLGVGFIGEGRFRITINGKITSEYAVWQNMLARCYSSKYHLKNPTYIGCAVCEEWRNFQNFAEWMSGQDYEGKQLDKDIKVDGNKVYSPEACMFVSRRENAVKANAKHYTFISPEGVRVDVYNLREFCRENNLNQSHMCLVHLGKRGYHKGWTKA